MTSGAKVKSPTILASRLRWIREDAGLNQKQFATRLWTGANRISDYETGIREPGLHMLRRYAAFAGVTLSELLDGIDHQATNPLLSRPPGGGRAPAPHLPPRGAGNQLPTK
ncbi:helix-turn-helix domain-containing protein [Mycobacterium sp. C3-094]